MEITINGDTLVFSRDVMGMIELERQIFNGKAAERVQVGTMLPGGNGTLTKPYGLKSGLYYAYCANQLICQNLYLGDKPEVVWNVDSYFKYNNEEVFRYTLNFGEFEVSPGKDFFLKYGEKALPLPTRGRSKSFDFLFSSNRITPELSEDLQRFIDLR